MSIVTYGNITYDIIEEIKNNNLYFIYSCCQNSETKEYVVIEKINKEKFRDELSKLPINDINKTFEEYVKAYEKDINLLKETSSPNILKGIDFIDRDNEFIIIKEYADINLKDYIKKEKKKGISPKVNIPEEKVIRKLNATYLSRIFSNLLNNAVKYSEGDLEINLEQDGTILFSNYAPGLNGVDVEKLFDRFYTVETAHNSTGLGLSIVKLLTERQGGSIASSFKDNRLEIKIVFKS